MKNIEILHEDEDLLVINKPPYLRSTPDRFHTEWPSVYGNLQKIYGEEGVFMVHRLDKDTSGVMCLARHAEAHRHLSLQFQNRQTEKYYLALVQGNPAEDRGEIDAAIARHPTIEGKMCINKQGKASYTEYEVLERFKGFAWLRCKILTGRMHQVRVHLAHIGHPLAVDPLYGGTQALYLSAIKRRRFNLGKYVEEERPLLERVPLHATALTVLHPSSGQPLTIEAEPPKDIRAVLSQLGKWGRGQD